MKSRIGRLEYVTRFILLTIIWFTALIFVSTDESLIKLANAVYTVGLLWIAIPRLHDVSHTGWATLIFVLPFVNIFFGLWLLLKRGTVGVNKWGDEPPVRIAFFHRFGREHARA